MRHGTPSSTVAAEYAYFQHRAEQDKGGGASAGPAMSGLEDGSVHGGSTVPGFVIVEPYHIIGVVSWRAFQQPFYRRRGECSATEKSTGSGR